MPNPDPSMPRTMTIADAVAWTGMSRSSLYRLAATGKIKLLKFGRSTLVDGASLAALVDSLPVATIAQPSPAKVA